MLSTTTKTKFGYLQEVNYGSADGKGAMKVHLSHNASRDAKDGLASSYTAPAPATPTPATPATPAAATEGSATTEIVVFGAAAAAGIGAAVALGMFL